MTPLVRAVGRALFGDYELYAIYAIDTAPGRGPVGDTPGQAMFVPLNGPEQLPAELAEVAAYAGPEAALFGLRVGKDYVAACVFQWGRRYARERGFIPLADGEAKLVQITTAPAARGQGAARTLIAAASSAMAQRGFVRLYARVWRGHKASQKAFVAAGWEHCAWVVGLRILNIAPRLRLTFGRLRP
ncbi:hypothetical protein CCR80_09640 [Rhodothalassium salexigens]|uniref:GNAT family N-acetyltransferase n=1 Tax=Rhodothalassium salexigens TaxID=1086 RepID=UPI0019127AB3|nr:GNAT family N-acetyltransferase [Rhodothalassium salexigens]MBK5921290.1 hypothetical protein [Rhodothalassium salexigens]